MFVVEGGKRLDGVASPSGAKNSLQFLVGAALLTTGVVTLARVPRIADTYTLIDILRELGCTTEFDDPRELLTIGAEGLSKFDVPPLGGLLRSVVLLAPGLLLRFGQARIPAPGGDRIGRRPLDSHFAALEQLGGAVRRSSDGFVLTANSLRAATVTLPFPSFTGTGFAMLLAAGLAGRTTIHNAAREPELLDLADLLTQMGAVTSGVGTSTVSVVGVSDLGSGHIQVQPDRLVSGTLLLACAATRGSLTLKGIQSEALTQLLEPLSDAGCDVSVTNDSVSLAREGDLRQINIVTGPHPAFPTDLQPQVMAAVTQAMGTSSVTETLFEDRFLHVPHLRAMGAAIDVRGATATVHGPSELSGADVVATDIRGGASLLIAALCAKGTSRIAGSYHVRRGYPDLAPMLCGLGVDVVEMPREDVARDRQ